MEGRSEGEWKASRGGIVQPWVIGCWMAAGWEAHHLHTSDLQYTASLTPGQIDGPADWLPALS
jgi:hypothetical protein